MDKKTLRTLRIGDTVRIHFTHMGSRPDDVRGKPFDVVIAKFNNTGRAYKEDDGHYYESRQISWRWADMPAELQPAECVRDDVRGLDIAHEDYIIDIVARAPYQVRIQPRNVLYVSEQEAFLDHQKVEAYRHAKGEPQGFYDRRHTQATGYIFSEWNETYDRDVRPGQYNGHVFKFAQALIARRSRLAISGPLDAERFYDAWEKAGRPGQAGPFRAMVSRSGWDEEEEKPAKAHPHKALLNRKAFTNWVVRNASRFVMTKAQELKNMIQSAIDEEDYMRKSMETDAQFDY